MEYNPLTFFWIAKYKDGTELRQFDEDGKEHSFREIDQGRLESFSWVPFTREQVLSLPIRCVSRPLPTYTLHLRENQRLIAVRRNYITYGKGFEERRTIYLLGWQETINGKNYKSILYIHEDGSVEVSDSFEFK